VRSPRQLERLSRSFETLKSVQIARKAERELALAATEREEVEMAQSFVRLSEMGLSSVSSFTRRSAALQKRKNDLRKDIEAAVRKLERIRMVSKFLERELARASSRLELLAEEELTEEQGAWDCKPEASLQH
jgi:hypothetical protein